MGEDERVESAGVEGEHAQVGHRAEEVLEQRERVVPEVEQILVEEETEVDMKPSAKEGGT